MKNKFVKLSHRMLVTAVVSLFSLISMPGSAVAASDSSQASSGIIATNAPSQHSEPEWLSKALTLSDCLNIALSCNSDIRKSQFAVEAAMGQAITNRAIVIPKVVGSMSTSQVQDRYVESIDVSSLLDKYNIHNIDVPNMNFPTASWNSSILVQQQFFQGGRIVASLKVAKHVKEEALYSHQATITDTLTNVRIKFFDVLLAIEEIKVNEASVKLLEKEFEDSKRRLKAGTVPKFNVLRAEVELANAQPPLIKARNDYRIAKNDLCNLLGYDVPKTVWEDIPLNLAGELEMTPFEIDLGVAMAKAIENRPELGQLREAQQIARQNVRMARSGYFPGITGYAGYQGKSSSYKTDLTEALHGWVVGGQLNWNIFDGLATKGSMDIAKANLAKSEEEIVSTVRSIEVEVRTAYSNFIQAKETLESQLKNVELATEALRLANAQQEAGSGTQLDVLDAETSLTDARTTWVNALHDYSVSLANLERAIGINIMQESIVLPTGDTQQPEQKAESVVKKEAE